MAIKIGNTDSLYNLVYNIVSDSIDKSLDEMEYELPDCIYDIWDYIPALFKDDKEKNYIDSLWLAFNTSFENKLYQFAYIQYHMLFMSALYFTALKISWLHKEEFEKVIYYLSKGDAGSFYTSNNTRNGEIFFGSFALISESDFFLILKIIGMDDNMLGRLRKLVETRNKYAHANGNMMITSEDEFIKQIKAYNSELEKIFKFLENDISNLYEKNLTDADFYDPEVRSYIDTDEQIVEGFIRVNLLSPTEINWLRKKDINLYKKHDGFKEIKDLHYALCHYYDILNTDDDYLPIEDKYLQYKYHDNATEFIESELNISAYSCTKDGGTYPLYECPECEEEQLVHDAENGKFHCFHCDTDYESNELMICSGCGNVAVKTEVDLCKNCIDAKMKE